MHRRHPYGAFIRKQVMSVRLSNSVFLRHVGDESVVWCPRTGGCTILRNAKLILDEVTLSWRNEEEIARAVASKFGCAVDEVRNDVKAVIAELTAQMFVECDSTETTDVSSARGGTLALASATSTSPSDEDWMPLADFYAKHGLPSELHIDLTDACNEKCVHCYLPHGGRHFLDKEIAFKVLREFREAQGLTVYVSGGECMLHKNFPEILRYAKSLDLNIIVMSNLALCDEKMVALLKGIDPQFVNVSLYAVDDDTHDSITQTPGSCRRTKAAIDALRSVGVHIRIATPFMHANKGCVADLKDYAARRRVHLIADAEIFGQIDHSCANQRHALSMGELKELVATHKDVFRKRPNEPEMCGRESKVCDVGEARLNLDAEGRYYPCDGFHGALIGNARSDSLWEVWTGEALDKLRKLKNNDFGACATCADRAWCKVCPMRNFNETGDMFTHAPWRCEATRIYRKTFEGR